MDKNEGLVMHQTFGIYARLHNMKLINKEKVVFLENLRYNRIT